MIYNQWRPHGKLNMRVPAEVHGDGIIPEKIMGKTAGDKTCSGLVAMGVETRRVWGAAPLRSDSLRSPSLRCADAPTRSPEGS